MSIIIFTVIALMAILNSEIFSLAMLTIGAFWAIGRFFLAIAEHGEW